MSEEYSTSVERAEALPSVGLQSGSPLEGWRTPGPWFVHDFRAASSEPTVGDITVSCDHPATITVCYMGRALTATPEEALANAAAIAAMPDLLRACQLLEAAEDFNANDCQECDGEGEPELCPICCPLFDEARIARRNAIARAAMPLSSEVERQTSSEASTGNPATDDPNPSSPKTGEQG